MNELCKAVITALKTINFNNHTTEITHEGVKFKIQANVLTIVVRAIITENHNQIGSNISISNDSAYESYDEGDALFDTNMFSANMNSSHTNSGIDFIEKSLKNNQINAMLLNFWKELIESKNSKVEFEQFFKRLESEEAAALAAR